MDQPSSSPSSSYRPQIIVALIGTAGVLGAAVLSNWDKITGAHSATPAPAASTAALPATQQPAPASDAVEGLAGAQRNAYGAATSALDDVASKISAASTADISGAWRSVDGSGFVVEQKGDAYAYRQYAANGALIGGGSGRMTGNEMQHDYQAPSLNIAAGLCRGTLAPDGLSITGSCVNQANGNSWNFRIAR